MKATIVPIPIRQRIKTSMESHNEINLRPVNPLSPFMNLMKRCVVLGFPLKMRGLTITTVCPKAYSRYWPLLSYIVLSNLGQIPMFFVLYYNGITLETMIKTIRQQGHTVMDVVAIFGIFVPQTIGMVKQSNNLLSIPHQWNSLNNQMTEFLSEGKPLIFIHF